MSYSDWDPERGRCLHLAYSDDGVNWRRDPANPVLSPVQDTRHNLYYDEENERWLLYTRPITTARANGVWTLLCHLGSSSSVHKARLARGARRLSELPPRG